MDQKRNVKKVIIPELGIGLIPIVVSSLNAKKFAMKIFTSYEAHAKVGTCIWI